MKKTSLAALFIMSAFFSFSLKADYQEGDTIFTQCEACITDSNFAGHVMNKYMSSDRSVRSYIVFNDTIQVVRTVEVTYKHQPNSSKYWKVEVCC